MTNSQAEALLSKQLGVLVARMRTEKELSQETLAAEIGISTNHLQLLESGLSDRKKQSPANPRLSTLLALSEALEVSLPDLLKTAQGGAPD